MFLKSSKNGKETLELVSKFLKILHLKNFLSRYQTSRELIKIFKILCRKSAEKEIKKKIPKTSHIWIQEIVLNKLQKPNKRMSKKDMAIKA